jgi:hypothetical protein
MVIFYQLILFLSYIKIINLEKEYSIRESDGIFDIDIDFIINNINIIKENPTILINYIPVFKGIIISFENLNLSGLMPIVNDLLNVSTNSFINDTCELISSNYSEINVLDYIINILNHIKENKDTFDSIDYNYILDNVFHFVNYPGMDKIVNHFIPHKKIFFYILEFIGKEEKYKNLFEAFKDFLWIYNDKFVDIIYDLIKSYNDSEKMANVSYIFFKENQDLIKKLKEIIIPRMIEISKIFQLRDKYFNAIKEKIFEDIYVIDIMEKCFNSTKIMKTLFDFLKHAENNKFSFDYLYIFLKTFKEESIFSQSFSNFIVDSIIKAIKEIINKQEFTGIIISSLMKKLEDFFFNRFTASDLSQDCSFLFKNIFFGNRIDLQEFYLKKILMDNSLDKNDFLTFENCLSYKTSQQLNYSNYTIKPIYVIGLIDDVTNKTKLETSMLKEKYNYLLGLCLPYGFFKKGGKEEPICKNTDYNKIMKVAAETNKNMNSAEIKSFFIFNNNFEAKDYIIGFFSLIFLCFPLLIRLFLFIYKSIKTRKIKKNSNKLISENNYGKKKIYKIKNHFEQNFKSPRWYKYLSIFFSIEKNAEELFNFSLNVTKFYNFNGITYIKGILGFSMILYILGHNFLILFNLPSKVFSLYEFYNCMKNPFYSIIFIGLRYSPRIILSCSGYILAYKYLCYLEQEHKNYFIKFLFLQSYKYILFLLAIMFFRALIYYINVLFTQKRRPMMEIFYTIFYDENYLVRIFSFLTYLLGDVDFQFRQSVIQYFYLPINESFCFIIGTILISLGYKFKIKIDFVIIFIALFLYILKIFFIFYEEDFYPTQYIYLYYYGELMISPLFNMPSYLIGMYFGLINYSIQKGIVVFKKDRAYSMNMIQLLELKENLNKENDDEKEKENNGDDFIGRSLSLLSNKNNNNKSIKKKETFARNKIDNSIKKNLINSEIRKSIIHENKNSSISIEDIKNDNINNDFIPIKDNNEEQNIKDNELDEKVKNMPFLIMPTKILNFHRRNNGKFYFRIIIIIGVAFIVFSSIVQYIVINNIENNIENKDKTDIKKLSLENYINNSLLNIYYSLDIELIIFVTNWVFFILYSGGKKIADVYDFFNNNYWSFFVKSYFSFILVSTPIIIYIFYQSETVIYFRFETIFLYFFINTILSLIASILIYICYEFPFKKIFKTCQIKNEIINLESDDDLDDENDPDETEAIY